jgi:hypothetical protein
VAKYRRQRASVDMEEARHASTHHRASTETPASVEDEQCGGARDDHGSRLEATGERKPETSRDDGDRGARRRRIALADTVTSCEARSALVYHHCCG